MWYKFDWRLFIKIYIIIAAIAIVVMFTLGMGCDERAQEAPMLCHTVFAILYATHGFVYLMFSSSDFLNDHGLFSIAIAWVVHAYVIMLLVNLIKEKFLHKKSN